MGGGEHLLVAGSKPHRLVVVVEVGVAGIDAGDEPCGCRGTGVVEPVARERGEGRAIVLRAPGDAVKLTAMVVRPLDGRSVVGDELVRRRVRVSYVQWLRSSRGRKERMGRWQAHGGCDGADGEVGGDSRAGESSGLDLLDVVDVCGANGEVGGELLRC